MTLAITIFSDFACPFSYLAEDSLRRLSSEAVALRHRAARQVQSSPWQDGEEAWRPLVEAARVQGLDLGIPSLHADTHKAHEAALFARVLGVEEALRAAIFRAYWRDGADIGRIDVLMALAAELGIDPEELKIALDIDKHSEEVENDFVLARKLHIEATPVTYLGTGPSAKVITGAYTSEQLQTLLQSGDLLQAGING